MDDHNPQTPGPLDRATNAPAHPPAPDLLAELYRHLPVLVAHLTTDGTVLHVNPEVARATGYAAAELLGKNFWALLFPGRLFAQVPKFISAIHPLTAIATDVPMTLRMKNGQDRIIAWSRFVHNTGIDSQAPSVVCIGKDLTDRLLDSDNDSQPPRQSIAFGPPVGNLGTVDGDIVTPLAISPPAPGAGEPTVAIQQVHEFLTEIDNRIDAIQNAASRGEIDAIAGIAATLSHGAHACGLLDFSSRAESLRLAAAQGSLQSVNTLVQEIVTLCRPRMR